MVYNLVLLVRLKLVNATLLNPAILIVVVAVQQNSLIQNDHQLEIMSSSYGYGDQTLNQQSAYVPTTASFKSKSTAQKMNKGDKRTTVLRKGAGKQWEDTSLLDWDPCE